MMTIKLVGVGNTKVFLFPGLTGTQTAFDAMLAFCDTDTFQYAVMDYRGYGDAKDIEGQFSLQEIVADAVEAIESLGWTDVTAAGHSVGALVAQMLALALPTRISRLVSLAGMNAGGGSRNPDRRQLLSAAAVDFDKRVALVEMGCRDHYAAGFATTVVNATWKDILPAAFAGYGRDAAETDITALIMDTPLPMLAIVGERDPGNTAELARATTLKWFPNAILEVFVGVGHYPMIESPALTISALERFVGTAPKAS